MCMYLLYVYFYVTGMYEKYVRNVCIYLCMYVFMYVYMYLCVCV
jgi:hypothetical protein